MSADCVLCGRPMAETAYADALCATQAAQNLARVVELCPDARAVSWGVSGRQGSGSSGKPGSRSPGNDDALDALGEIQGTLTTWARHVAEERGGDLWLAPDPIVHSARYLAEHVEWLRHRAEVDEAFRDFAEAASKLRWIVDGPAARKYLGPCGAPLNAPEWCHCVEAGYPGPHRPSEGCESLQEPGTCEGDVYGRAGAKTGTCRTCGATVDQAERRAWLDEQVRGQAFRAAHIADAYGLNVKTIRSWAERGHLLEHGRDRDDRPLYLVGEVLDLAVKAAARRAENEAKRDRRQHAEMGA